jgi:hypothetical protein
MSYERLIQACHEFIRAARNLEDVMANGYDDLEGAVATKDRAEASERLRLARAALRESLKIAKRTSRSESKTE